MRCCPCKTVNFEIDNSDEFNELQRKERALKLKEKELLNKDKILRREISKFKKRKNNKIKADLRAAAKLNDARNKLLLTIDTRENFNRKKRRAKNRARSDARQTKKKTNVNKSKLTHYAALDYFNDLFNRPCAFSRQDYKKRTDSFLGRLFARPCSTKHCNKQKHEKLNCRSSRIAQESSCCKESYWERAAGDCYLMSLRRPPQLWVYHRWPQFYPQYLEAKHQWKNCGQVMLCLAGILFWTPCLVCLELCKCCFCACCTDC